MRTRVFHAKTVSFLISLPLGEKLKARSTIDTASLRVKPSRCAQFRRSTSKILQRNLQTASHVYGHFLISSVNDFRHPTLNFPFPSLRLLRAVDKLRSSDGFQ